MQTGAVMHHRPFALPCIATAFFLAGISQSTPVSAQSEEPSAPEHRIVLQSTWIDPDAAARRLAVARAEASVAVATREGRHGDALDLLERVHEDQLARDRDSLRRLARAAGQLDPPGGEPGWLVAGIALLAAGGAGGIVTPLAWALASPCWSGGCGARDPGPLIAGLVFSGTFLLAGLVLMGVYLVRHVFDPARRSFLQRRSTLMELLVRESATAGITW